MSFCCVKPLATNLALYFDIELSEFCLTLNIHLQSIALLPGGNSVNVPTLRRSNRPIVKPLRFEDYYLSDNKGNTTYEDDYVFKTQLSDISTPSTFEEATQIPEWKEAMEEEYQSLIKKQYLDIN